MGCQMRSSALRQHRHLVGDDAGISVGRAERRQAAALAGRHDEENGLLQLNDCLPYAAGLEAISGTHGQALQGGRHRRYMLRVFSAEISGGSDEQAVAGQDHRLPEIVHAVG